MEAHFSQRGGFPRLVAAMRLSGSENGLGIDDGICVEVRDGRLYVRGSGRAYIARAAGVGDLRVTLVEPGMEMAFP